MAKVKCECCGNYILDTESNESAYQQHLEEENNNRYDSDSDYDWDSGDSWDSGGTDWDSDW